MLLEEEKIELSRLQVEAMVFGLPHMSKQSVERYEELLRKAEEEEDAPRSPSEPV